MEADCRNHAAKMREISMTCTYDTRTNRATQSSGATIPIHEMGDGYSRTPPPIKAMMIPTRHDRLLHQMDRSRSIPLYKGRTSQEIHLEEHHMLTRAPVRNCDE